MVAALGSGVTPTRPDRRLVSDAPRLPLRSLPAFSKTITLTWQGVANALLARITRSAEGILIETAGTTVSVGLREWPMPFGRRRSRAAVRERMSCPRCDGSCDILFWVGEWGCRSCLGLDYPCRHRQRWCPAIARRARLLHKLARYSPRGLKARLLRAQIAHEQRRCSRI